MSNLIRFNPHRDSLGLREMSRLMDDFFRFPTTETTRSAYPATDVSETGDAYTVTVEIPGLKKDGIELSVHDNTLSLRFTKEEQKKEEGQTFRHIERSCGTFERHFPFATALDASKVKATYKDGLLEVTLPKAVEARQRKIEVELLS
jgi:HSP20 family protein